MGGWTLKRSRNQVIDSHLKDFLSSWRTAKSCVTFLSEKGFYHTPTSTQMGYILKQHPNIMKRKSNPSWVSGGDTVYKYRSGRS